MAKKSSANLQAGQFKEGRRQLRTVWAQQWEASAIGNQQAIHQLLAAISHVGSRAANYGRVIEWLVEEDDDVTLDAILEERTVPVSAAQDLGMATESISQFAAWTPPYWYQPWYQPCREPRSCSYPV